MYAEHVCMFAKLVSIYAKLVCMPVYVCLRKIIRRRARLDSLRKPFSIWYLIQFFGDSWGGVLWMIQISKTPLPVRFFQNHSACAAFSKPLCLWSFFETPLPTTLFQNISACEALSKPLCQWSFFKCPLPVKPFQNPSACGAFSKPLCLWTFSKPLCLWGFFKTPHMLHMYVCSPSMYVCLQSLYVCLPSLYVCLGKIMLRRRGPLPYENLSVFDV